MTLLSLQHWRWGFKKNRFMVNENIDAIITRKVIFIYSLLILLLHDKCYIKIRLVIVDTTAAPALYIVGQ